MADIWAACAGRARPAPLAGTLLRLVESQEQVATTALVDDLAEQALLEAMIESVKPPRRPGTQRLHYLLATPFRYPPLRHGSRFGSRFEPSLLYGSHAVPTALTEIAYYRLVFWSGMRVPPPAGHLLTQHTLFAAAYASDRGLDLHAPPFDAFESALRDPADYAATQRLGAALREAGVEAIAYVSARDPGRGINVALFGPGALPEPGPLRQEAWLCDTSAGAVTLSGPTPGTVHRFALEDFLVDGRLPAPAV